MPQRARYRKRSNPLLPWPRKLGPDERRARLNLCIFNTRLLCIFHASFCHTETVPWNRTATKTRARAWTCQEREIHQIYIPPSQHNSTHMDVYPFCKATSAFRTLLPWGLRTFWNWSSYCQGEGGTFTFELCTSLSRAYIFHTEEAFLTVMSRLEA